MKCCDLLIERLCHIHLHIYKIAYLSLMWSESVFILEPRWWLGHFPGSILFPLREKKTTFTYIWWLMVNYLRCVQIIDVSMIPLQSLFSGFWFLRERIQTETGLAAKIKKIRLQLTGIGHPKKAIRQEFFQRVIKYGVWSLLFPYFQGRGQEYIYIFSLANWFKWNLPEFHWDLDLIPCDWLEICCFFFFNLFWDCRHFFYLA